MKRKDGIIGLLITFFISSQILTGCAEKVKKTEKKDVKVETLTVGNTSLGGANDYVGTIEEKTGSTLSFEIAGNITSIRVLGKTLKSHLIVDAERTHDERRA